MHKIKKPTDRLSRSVHESRDVVNMYKNRDRSLQRRRLSIGHEDSEDAKARIRRHRAHPLKSSMRVKTLAQSLQTRKIVRIEDRPERHQITIDSLQIREYPRCLGINPSVSTGPPLTIGWQYRNATPSGSNKKNSEQGKEKERVISVDEYEELRGVRREKSEMLVPASAREEMLAEWGHSRMEMNMASKAGMLDRSRRDKSAQSTSKRSRSIQERMEGLRKSLGRLSHTRDSSKALYKNYLLELRQMEEYIDNSDHSKFSDSTPDLQNTFNQSSFF
eukprot:scaffold219634_cov56-Attheya_sp.AAC.2